MRQGAANNRGSRLALSFDIGGTFTDFTLVDLATGQVVAEHKTPTDPVDPAASSLAGWRDLVADGRLRPEELAFVVHATTLVTNAVIERKGAPTALLTTAGFRDLLTFGREQMYDIYDLFAPPAEPLVPRELRVEVDERMTARRQPELRPLDPAQVARRDPATGRARRRGGRDRVPAQLPGARPRGAGGDGHRGGVPAPRRLALVAGRASDRRVRALLDDSRRRVRQGPGP